MKKLILICLSLIFVSCSVLLGPAPEQLKKELPAIDISLSLKSGSYNKDQTLNITAKPADAEIRYLINSGQDLTCSNGIKYKNSIIIKESQKFKAIACKKGYQFNTDEANYVIAGKIGTPIFELTQPGKHKTYKDVKFSVTPSDAVIYFTLDNSVPAVPSICGESGTGSTRKYNKDAIINLTTYTNVRLVACKEGMQKSNEKQGEFAIPFYHVDESVSGNDCNNGSARTPFSTIIYAMNKAQAGDTIKVKGGNYKTETITFTPEVKLLGGYDEKYKERNEKSLINGSGYNRVISFSGEMSNKTVLDGFYIIGGDIDNVNAISISNGASPTIKNNFIFAGKNNITTSHGIEITSTSTGISKPTIYNNFIHGGKSSDTKGIISDSSAPYILNNTIFAGKGLNPVAIDLVSAYSGTTIINNLLFCYNPRNVALKDNKNYINGSKLNNISYNHTAYCEEIKQYDGNNTNDKDANLAQYFIDYDDDKLFVDNDWKLKKSFVSNFKERVTNGGKNLNEEWGFNMDAFGNERTGKWSKGAHELN